MWCGTNLELVYSIFPGLAELYCTRSEFLLDKPGARIERAPLQPWTDSPCDYQPRTDNPCRWGIEVFLWPGALTRTIATPWPCVCTAEVVLLAEQTHASQGRGFISLGILNIRFLEQHTAYGAWVLRSQWNSSCATGTCGVSVKFHEARLFRSSCGDVRVSSCKTTIASSKFNLGVRGRSQHTRTFWWLLWTKCTTDAVPKTPNVVQWLISTSCTSLLCIRDHMKGSQAVKNWAKVFANNLSHTFKVPGDMSTSIVLNFKIFSKTTAFRGGLNGSLNEVLRTRCSLCATFFPFLSSKHL